VQVARALKLNFGYPTLDINKRGLGWFFTPELDHTTSAVTQPLILDFWVPCPSRFLKRGAFDLISANPKSVSYGQLLTHSASRTASLKDVVRLTIQKQLEG
jgi:hypothetical protein